ncbi:hypothetical protein EST38_g11770 [Candolleomyces aberdarensis]|uniref:Uncharacterized protein n=1 Tax=Candolleomyces aberdarensis TaxID=2316362 RepID=A0A4Q2D5K4_9AGAR|nr:hypothetical protein EST38_g11770 [Candolleomyces aberdarensis]
MLQGSPCSLKRLALPDLDIGNHPHLTIEELSRFILQDHDIHPLVPNLQTLAITIFLPDDEKIRLLQEIIRSRSPQHNVDAYDHPRTLQRVFVWWPDRSPRISFQPELLIDHPHLDANEREKLHDLKMKLAIWKSRSWPSRENVDNCRLSSRWFYLRAIGAISSALDQIEEIQVNDRVDCLGLYLSEILTDLSKFADSPREVFDLKGHFISQLQRRTKALLDEKWKPVFLEHLARKPWSYRDYDQSYWELNVNARKNKHSLPFAFG